VAVIAFGRFLAVRVLHAATTLFLVCVVIFLLTTVLGDPIGSLLPPDAPAAEYARMRAYYGYDQPLLTQFTRFIFGVVRFDFGVSTMYQKPAMEVLSGTLGVTLQLALGAFTLAVLVGVPLGMLSGYHANTMIDRGVLTFATLCQTVPIFVFGLAMIYLFAIKLRWFPAGGTRGALSFVMPTIALSLWVGAAFIRLGRSAMRGVLIQQYILLARAKGLSELQLLVSHALRNALAPLISYGGLQFGMLLTGAVVTESLFGLQGIGLTVLRAVDDRDLNVVKAGVVVAAFGFVVMNLMADVIHGLVDPRAMKMPAR